MTPGQYCVFCDGDLPWRRSDRKCSFAVAEFVRMGAAAAHSAPGIDCYPLVAAALCPVAPPPKRPILAVPIRVLALGEICSIL